METKRKYKKKKSEIVDNQKRVIEENNLINKSIEESTLQLEEKKVVDQELTISALKEELPTQILEEEKLVEEILPIQILENETLSIQNLEEEKVAEEILHTEVLEKEKVPNEILPTEVLEEEKVPNEILPTEVLEEENFENSILAKDLDELNKINENIIVIPNNEILSSSIILNSIDKDLQQSAEIDKIIDTLKSENIIDKINLNEDNENKYILNENEINNILNTMSVNENIIKNDKKNIELHTNKIQVQTNISIYEEDNYEILNKLTNNYTLDNLKYIFHTFDKAIILVDIVDGIIKYIEKKGQESRNQSIIDILYKTNNYKKLPNCQFLIFTNDFIDNLEASNFPFVFTLCKNNIYNTTLLPNFNFNHWLEANIEDYQVVYNNFINNQINWNEKEDKIFWSGADTNIIRNKIHKETISDSKYIINLIDRSKNNNKYYTIYEHKNYKYLLNMNGYSYGGRLNYLFLTGSCVIILKNEEKHKQWDEFFYKNFIPNEDYIEILYNDNEYAFNVVNRINNAINSNDCEKIAQNCLIKAIKIFQLENIYEYIYNKVTLLSEKNTINDHLKNNIIYTPSLNHFFKNRLNSVNNNINFFFQGNDLELNLIDYKNQENKDLFNILNIKIINNNTIINLNDNIIYNKYTPYIVHSGKSQNYNINIQNSFLNIIVEKKFNLVQCNIINSIENNPIQFNISEVEIKTINGGWWVI